MSKKYFYYHKPVIFYKSIIQPYKLIGAQISTYFQLETLPDKRKRKIQLEFPRRQHWNQRYLLSSLNINGRTCMTANIPIYTLLTHTFHTGAAAPSSLPQCHYGEIRQSEQAWQSGLFQSKRNFVGRWCIFSQVNFEFPRYGLKKPEPYQLRGLQTLDLKKKQATDTLVPAFWSLFVTFRLIFQSLCYSDASTWIAPP